MVSLSSALPPAIQDKLAKILASKSARGGPFCLPFDTAHFPLQVRSLFPSFRSYVLEIGSGWGEFTRAYAQANPQSLTIALEKKLARVIASSRQQSAENITNIRYMVLDIAWFFDGIFAPEQFDVITINFPDPWPKQRHHKHRFISPDFAIQLAAISREGAQLTLATDDYAYAREAMTVFEHSPAWKNNVAPWIALEHIAGRPQSYFETLHRQEGAPIYFVCYTKQTIF